VERALFIFGLLVACLILSIEQAWLCATWSAVTYDSDFTLRPATWSELRTWERSTPPLPGMQPVAFRTGAGHGVRTQVMLGERPRRSVQAIPWRRALVFPGARGTPFDALVHVECGWPLPCLSGERWEIGVSPLAEYGPGFVDRRHGAWRPTDTAGSSLSFVRPRALGGASLRMLPLRPHWRNLLLNALCYAAGIVVTGLAFRLVVVAIRDAQGRCGGCGYPAGASRLCSECGYDVGGTGRPHAASRDR
jgi:hypothetical protein